jgi:hypothetical protein
MSLIPKKSDIVFQNIYITSDEEIKEGDWYLNLKLHICQKSTDKNYLKGTFDSCQKIILTTDPNLIADGVQAIDNEFLEWFVKNPSCEYVNFISYSNEKATKDYELIIPQEELNYNMKQEILEEMERLEKEYKQETLEEAAKLYIGVPITRIIDDEERYYTSNIGEYDAFIQGAKWQQEIMLAFINDEDNHTEGELGNSCIDVQTLVNFIKQFKNK